jgi:hypothetical protein
VWWSNGILCVVVKGESYGTMASVDFETSDKSAAEIYFTPIELRPGLRRGKRPRKLSTPGQLDQIREAARRIQDHCSDVLAGDLTRFNAIARPLPPYLRPRP